MTNEQIIEMAKQAGIEFATHTGITGKATTSTLGSQRIEVMQRFAQLVRNAALEEAAVKREEIDFSYSACEQFVSGEAAFECGKQIRSMKK